MTQNIGFPQINWIENDPKYQCHYDGNIYLVAIRINDDDKNKKFWDFDVIRFSGDDECSSFYYREGDVYDAWVFEDFDYFALLEGTMPHEFEEGEVENEN